MRKAVQLGLERNPALNQVRKELEAADASTGVARAALFPQLGADFTAKHSKDAVLGTNYPQFGGEPYNHYDFGVRLDQTLFQIGAISAIQASNRGFEAQEQNLAVAERELASRIVRAFYNLLLQDSNLQALEHVKRIQKESLATAQHRFQIGRGQNLDVLQVKTQLALIEPQVESARVASQTTALELSRLLGSPELESITVQGTLAIPKIPRISEKTPQGQPRTLNALPEFKQSQLAVEQAELQKDAVLGKNWPSLQAFGIWGRSAFVKSDLLDEGATAWAAGVKLSIPLFSGLSSVYERRSQNAQIAKLEAARDSTQQRLLTEQAQNKQKLGLAEKNVDSAVQAFDLARASLNEAERNFRSATINYLQLLAVQQAFFQAQSALNQARYQYIVATIDYSVSSGLPILELVETLDPGKTS